MKLIVYIFLCINLAQGNIGDINASLQAKDSNSSEQNITEQPAPKPQIVDFNTFEEFKGSAFKLPNNAKAISSISVRYIDEFGHIKEKIIDINQTVHWGDDFMIQKKPRALPSEILDVSVTSINPNFTFDRNRSSVAPKANFTALIELPLETLKYDDELKFVIKNKQIKLITNDRLKDSFMQPTRNVFGLELYRDDMNISRVNFAVNKGGFSDINVSKEHYYYTILIGVKDGNFTIQKEQNGYTILPKE